MKRLPYGAQVIEEDDLRAVEEQLRSEWLTQGPRVAEFEERLASAVGAKYAVAVSSGTAALHLACMAVGLSAGDEAFVPDVTFVATGNAVRYTGARPRLVDIDPTTGLVDLDKLEVAWAQRARASRPPSVVFPVHFSGSVPDMGRIRELAGRYGARVIEDAAHALGSTYRVDGTEYRAASCAHSDLAILSFHPVKHVTTGEGGAVITHDLAVRDRLLELRSHGITRDPARMRRNDGPWYYEQQTLGFNYRITDFQSALGISQLGKLTRFLSVRRRLAERYDRAFEQSDLAAQYKPLAVPNGVESARHLYVVRTIARGGETRDDVRARRLFAFGWLREHNIFAQVHYVPVHSQPSFADAGLGEGEFEGADEYYAGCMSLPLFPGMVDSDVDRVVECLRAMPTSAATR